MRTRIVLAGIVAVVLAVGATALLVNVFQRKQEARNPFYRVVELSDDVEDPAVWGKNFPLQWDGYRRTVDQIRTRFGGSEAVPRTPTAADPRSIVAQSRLEADPRLKTCGRGTRSRWTSERSAATRTCSTTRPSPSASTPRSSRGRASTATPRWSSPIARPATAT